MDFVRGFSGVIALLGIAWLLSSDRRRFPWKIVIGGLALQWALALFILKTNVGDAIFTRIAELVKSVLDGAMAGATFVGEMVTPDKTPWFINVGVIILSTIIFISMLASIGYYFGILQRVVRGMAWVMRKSMGVTGAESLAAAANVFLGQTEAPLLVRPYIPTMSRSELMAMMTGGFATVAAGVLFVYVQMLDEAAVGLSLDITRHLLTACLMSAPGAFVMAKIMMPPAATVDSDVEGVTGSTDEVVVNVAKPGENLLDAMTEGASQGMKLAINVLAMLIAFVALIHLIDAGLGLLGSQTWFSPVLDLLGLKTLSLSGLLGLIFRPVAYLIGIGPDDRSQIASLIGTSMATNEIIAYKGLAAMIREHSVSDRSVYLTLYALCGFANLSSIGIQIGGIGPMAPGRRAELARLAPRAMLGGAMACWMTAAIAGTLI